MKNAFIAIFLIAIFSSCNKDNQLENFKTQLAGKWEIEKKSCGLCLNPLTTYPEGNGNIIVFLSDGTFERRIHDSVTFKGRFFLTKSNECGKPNTDIALSTDESIAILPLFVQIISGKLYISTPHCYMDGAGTTYRRIE